MKDLGAKYISVTIQIRFRGMRTIEKWGDTLEISSTSLQEHDTDTVI